MPSEDDPPVHCTQVLLTSPTPEIQVRQFEVDGPLQVRQEGSQFEQLKVAGSMYWDGPH